MPTAAKFEQQRQELASVLASGIFHRSPSLATLLIYICEKYFEGEGNQIKEYNIAVEALGRPAEFDQKRDSIVRVEAHRLRKRLKAYYEGAGSSHALRIEIPPGHYAPQFHFQETALAVRKEREPLEDLQFEFTTLSIQRGPFRRKKGYAAVGVVLLGMAAAGAIWFGVAQGRGAAPIYVEDPAPVGDEIRILAGSSRPYTDRFGQVWDADRNFEGGSPFSAPLHPVFGTRDPVLYQSGRTGSFRYDLPLKPGSYELRLHFAETVFGEGNAAGGGETSRLFNVFANGKMLLEMIDVIADAGSNSADIRVFKDIQPDKDGLLHLEYKPVVNVAFLNAIEVSPGIPGKMRPIRIVARDQGYIDKNGRSWSPDRFSQGGQLVLRTVPVSGAPDPEIYRGERFGNMRYDIPVAPGRYTLIVHFAETWFGPGKLQHGGIGSRSFDVLCNGVALLRELDVFKEAGGSDRALQKIFHGLEPSPQGKLVVSFVAHRNYASLNGIEVLDEAKPVRSSLLTTFEKHAAGSSARSSGNQEDGEKTNKGR